MDFISSSMHRVIMFIVKFVFIFWLLITLIILGRSIYCYSAASASAENLLPQIARLVAEENGCPMDNVMVNTGDSTYTAIYDLVASMNSSAAYHYVLPNNRAFKNSPNGICIASCGHSATCDDDLECSFYVRKVDPATGEPTGPNLTSQTDLGTARSIVQRGELIEIGVTVYATIVSDLKFGPNDTDGLNVHWKITKKMQVPAIKYYRGL